MDSLEKKWHQIHTKNLKKREDTRAERLLRRKLGLEIVRTKSAQRVHVVVPEVLDLFKNYDECIKFINQINQKVFNEEAFVFLDFSKCKIISAEMCVILGAEIDRCNRKIARSVFGTYPNYPEVYFLLNELGFYQLLGIKSTKPVFDEVSEVDVVRLQSGQDNPESLMRGIKELLPYSEVGTALDESEISAIETPFSKKIYRALTEAMANAVEHAYPKEFMEKSGNKCVPFWWRAGFKDNNKNTILIVLYDQGAGIPNTLTTNWREKLEEFMLQIAREPFDDEKLALAMEKGRSATKIKGRGQGSYDMQRLIRESCDGILSLFSYQGKYVYFNNGNWEKENLNLPLQGTLVIWKICLNTVQEN